MAVTGISANRLELLSIADAVAREKSIDREIVIGCDDSVALSGLGGLQLIRRSRGYVPRSFKLPHAGPPVLAASRMRVLSVSPSADRTRVVVRIWA